MNIQQTTHGSRMRHNTHSLEKTSEKLNKNQDKKQYNQDLRKASNLFEEFFTHQLMKTMKPKESQDSYFKKSEGETVFQEMLDAEYAKLSTQRQGVGISQFIYDQLKQ